MLGSHWSVPESRLLQHRPVNAPSRSCVPKSRFVSYSCFFVLLFHYLSWTLLAFFSFLFQNRSDQSGGFVLSCHAQISSYTSLSSSLHTVATYGLLSMNIRLLAHWLFEGRKKKEKRLKKKTSSNLLCTSSVQNRPAISKALINGSLIKSMMIWVLAQLYGRKQDLEINSSEHTKITLCPAM